MSEDLDAAFSGGQEDTALDTQEDSKTFSQDELDKIVGDRLARERKRYADYDELKSFKAQAEQSRKAQMSENEIAIELAKQEAANGVRLEYASKLAEASIRAELVGLVDSPEDVLEDLNLSRFLNEDHSINTEAVKALRAKYENLLGGKKKSTSASLGHGRSNDRPTGSVQDDFASFVNQF